MANVFDIASPNQRIRFRIDSAQGGSAVSGTYYMHGRHTPIFQEGKSIYGMVPFCGINPDRCMLSRSASFPIDYPGESARNGLGRFLPWKVLDANAHAVTLSLCFSGQAAGFSYPVSFESLQRYTVDNAGLHYRLGLKYTGGRALAAGLGVHPFIIRRFCGTGEKPRLSFDARRYFPRKRLSAVPSGQAAAVPPHFRFDNRRMNKADRVNHCYTDWRDRQAVLTWLKTGFRLILKANSPNLTHLHLWSMDEKVLSLEPETHVVTGLSRREIAAVRGSGFRLLRTGLEMSISASFLFENLPGRYSKYRRAWPERSE